MIHAANTVTYNMADDDESYNKEMESDTLALCRSGLLLFGASGYQTYYRYPGGHLALW
jgi:hypothetical protein